MQSAKGRVSQRVHQQIAPKPAAEYRPANIGASGAIVLFHLDTCFISGMRGDTARQQRRLGGVVIRGA